MKIAFLCKRRYTGSDVVSDRFGRLYEYPRQLARRGHHVRGYCLDYHSTTAGAWSHQESPGILEWESRDLGVLRVPAILHYPWHLLRRLRDFNPDVIFGASDMPHVVLTAWLSRRLGIPCAVDLYDNFESFSQARIPGLVTAFRRAVRAAGFVTVVSEPLRQVVVKEYGARAPVKVAVNAVDRNVFRKADRILARTGLGLPVDARLIGTAGGLSRAKGLAPLYAAWARIAPARPDVHLVLAGPVEKQLPPPDGERVHYLGQLPQTRISDLFNALDVGIITLLDSPFGRYCFPQKLHEMLACGLPVVAADVGVMNSMLHGAPRLLYRHDDPAGLAEAVLSQLADPMLPAVTPSSWEEIVAGIEPELLSLATSPHRGNPA